ncbi:MAG: ATP-binding protein [Streptosporangiales bacterium]|nr:ATP-binding protein [Streptosporangiales bacterium]
MLPHAPASVAVARQRLYSDLVAWGVFEPVADDAALVVSELISNALRHARPLPSGEIEVTWTLADGAVEVAVRDGGSSTEPRLSRPSLSSLGGRGLGIVQHLAKRWGVRYDNDATTVWAVVGVPEHQAHDNPSTNGLAHPTNAELR